MFLSIWFLFGGCHTTLGLCISATFFFFYPYGKGMEKLRSKTSRASAFLLVMYASLRIAIAIDIHIYTYVLIYICIWTVYVYITYTYIHIFCNYICIYIYVIMHVYFFQIDLNVELDISTSNCSHHMSNNIQHPRSWSQSFTCFGWALKMFSQGSEVGVHGFPSLDVPGHICKGRGKIHLSMCCKSSEIDEIFMILPFSL